MAEGLRVAACVAMSKQESTESSGPAPGAVDSKVKGSVPKEQADGKKPSKIRSPLRDNYKPTLQAGYFCGSCGAQQDLEPNNAIRCSQCGYRILYKTRERRRECCSKRAPLPCTHMLA